MVVVLAVVLNDVENVVVVSNVAVAANVVVVARVV